MNKTRQLSCVLTKEELQEKCSQLSTKLAEIDEAKNRLSAETKRLKEELESLQGQAYSLAREVRTKSEVRDVEIVEERDMEKKTLKTIRVDTNEVIYERPLMPIELQHELPLGGAKEISISIDESTVTDIKEALKKPRKSRKSEKSDSDSSSTEWWNEP